MLAQLSPRVLSHSFCDQESWHILVVGYASERVRVAVIAPRSWALSWRFKQGRALPNSRVGGRPTYSSGAGLTVPWCVVLSNMVAHHKLQKAVKWQFDHEMKVAARVTLSGGRIPFLTFARFCWLNLSQRSCPCQKRGYCTKMWGEWRWGLSNVWDGLPQGGKSQDAQLQWEQKAWVCDAVWTLMTGQRFCFSPARFVRDIAQGFSRYLQYTICRWGCLGISTVLNISMSHDGMHSHHAFGAKASEELREAAWVIVTRSTLDPSWVWFGINFGHCSSEAFHLTKFFPILTFIHTASVSTFMKLWWITRNSGCVLCVSLQIWLSRRLQGSCFTWDFEL